MYGSTGIVSATAFYGDGSNLSGVSTELTASIGVRSEGTFIGAGATIIDFKTTTGTNVTRLSCNQASQQSPFNLVSLLDSQSLLAVNLINTHNT